MSAAAHAHATPPAASRGVSWLQPRCACGSAAGLDSHCGDCGRKAMLGLQTKLVIGAPGDRYEREADQAADRVLAGGARPALTPLGSAPLQRDEDKPKPAPTPLGEGLATVGENLGENNPAFSLFSEQLADRFLAQPAPISVGVPAFLGANYAFLWGMALVNPAMRRSFDDFNLAMLPGLVPHFPVKTFQYRILDSAQTRFAFDIGLDASKLMQVFNEGVLNTRVSSLKFDTSGKLDTAGPQPLALSAMQVQLGLFGDGVLLSGGFRSGISPYPLMGDQGSRVMAQTPALPDLYADQRDVRFTLQLDLLKLADHFGGQAPAPRATNEPERLQREADAAAGTAPVADAAVQSTLAGSGAPLEPATRQFMESRFGHDFGHVRIHVDSGAAASARAVGARAYTVGRDIVFGRGQYAPATGAGRHLLAHELAHVVQQSAGAATSVQRQVTPPAAPAPVVPNPDQLRQITAARRAAAIRTQVAMFRVSGTEGQRWVREATNLARIKFDWPEPNMEQIGEILSGMGGGLVTVQVMVAGLGDPECGSRPGYVRGLRPPIVLCPAFFAADTSDESRIRTMVHEMAHARRIGSADLTEQYFPVFDCESTGSFDSADAWSNYVHCLSGQPPDAEVVTAGPGAGATP